MMKLNDLLIKIGIRKPEPEIAPYSAAAESDVKKLMMDGAAFKDIVRVSGLTAEQVDKIMDDNSRTHLIWMWIRNVDSFEMLRRTPYDACTVLRIIEDYKADVMEGRI